jgi:hypothetical protein
MITSDLLGWSTFSFRQSGPPTVVAYLKSSIQADACVARDFLGFQLSYELPNLLRIG